jgi:hypothetical protein
MQNYQSKPLSEGWTNGLFPKIKNGNYKIPKFQREFVWSLEQSAKLVDSIIKGYPVGTFILWKTKERFISIKNLGNHKLPEPPDNSEIYYVLDGQQRITSLYSAFNGLKIEKNDIGKEDIDFKRLYIDITNDIKEEDFVKILEKNQNLNAFQIPIHIIADGNDKYFNKLMEVSEKDKVLAKKLDKIKQQIQTGYSYSIIDVENTPIEVATDIFTRINTGGKELTSFEIMCAKTYIEKDDLKNEIGFDLSEEFDNFKEHLKEKEFDTISNKVILQAVSSIINGKVDTKSILTIDRYEFKEKWNECKDAILRTVNFLRENLGVNASRVIPYDGLIIPFTFYFYKSKNNPTGNIKSYLETIFWHTALSEAYSGSTIQALEKDISRVRHIIDYGTNPGFTFNTKAKLINLEKIKENGEFVATKAFCKAILCCYNLKRPKSIYNGSNLILENEYLLRSNSKQYHHFYPKAYLKTQKNISNLKMVNNIANIIFLDAESNLKIGKKSPEIYLDACKSNIEKNDAIFQDVLNSNLLPNFETEFSCYLDFDIFIEWRIRAVLDLVKSTIKILE